MILKVLPLLLLPAFALQVAPSKDGWIDRSPHRSDFVTVNEAKLHYLDWGGKGEALLLLGGMGNTAHSFDEFAPKFIDRFRVIALTRRGFGQSDKSAADYDTDTLVADIHAFLDALKIKSVSLIGHSFAGYELTRFAQLYPERVSKLVYLDCFQIHRPGKPIPRSARQSNETGRMQSRAGSVENQTIGSLRTSWKQDCPAATEALEANMREVNTVQPDGSVKPRDPEKTQEIVMELMLTYSQPDTIKIAKPALSFFTYPQLPPPGMEERIFKENLAKRRQQIEGLKSDNPQMRVVETTADHYCFFHQDRVVLEIRTFLLGE